MSHSQSQPTIPDEQQPPWPSQEDSRFDSPVALPEELAIPATGDFQPDDPGVLEIEIDVERTTPSDQLIPSADRAAPEYAEDRSDRTVGQAQTLTGKVEAF